MAKNPKKLIFISHKNSEKQIAISLKKILETAFLNVADFFVSSDPSSLPPGSAWFSEITQNLKRCSIQLIIASPQSVTRPWINFEAGAIFNTGNPVIPICHSGMTKHTLPKPLDELQGVNAHDKEDLSTILPIIAKALGCDSPEIDFSEFLESIGKFEHETEELQEFRENQSVQLIEGMSTVDIAILGSIANVVTNPNEAQYCNSVNSEVQRAGFTQLATNLGLRSLSRLGHIEIFDSDNGYDSGIMVRITELGWDFIQNNQNLFVMETTQEEHKKSIESFYDTENDVPF